jgi:hypothetical protein
VAALGIQPCLLHSDFNGARVDGMGISAYCSVMEKQLTEHEQHDLEMRNIIEEARVVLPGVQALFGFQTIAVFNERFEELAYYAKMCHALGLIMVIVSVAMVMTPAIYYRTCHGHATRPMVRLSSKMIRGALGPLAAGLALDMFTVIHVVTTGMPARLAFSIGAAAGTFALLAGLWFFVPRKAHKLLRATGSY